MIKQHFHNVKVAGLPARVSKSQPTEDRSGREARATYLCCNAQGRLTSPGLQIVHNLVDVCAMSEQQRNDVLVTDLRSIEIGHKGSRSQRTFAAAKNSGNCV